MKSEELTFLIDNLSGFTECIKSCFNVYGDRVFYINHKDDTPCIDITNILKDIYKFLWEEVYSEKYNFKNATSLLDSDIFEKFLTKYNYENYEIKIYISTSRVIDGCKTSVIQEDITPFIKIAFSSIRKYIEGKLYSLSEDGIRQFILKNIN